MRRLSLLALLVCMLGGGCTSREAPKPPRYLVVMVVDTCRADHVSAYGYKRPTTPCLDRLAAEGVLFERAFSQSNESLFSYASMFSGRYPRQLDELSHESYRVPARQPMLAGLLGAHGFDTAAFVAGGFLSAHYGLNRGFGIYRDEWDFGSFFNTVPPAIDWLDREVAGGRPAFLFVHAYDLHSPYANAAPFGRLYDPDYHGIAEEIATSADGVERIYDGRYYANIADDEMRRAAFSSADLVDPMYLLPGLAARHADAIPLSEADRRFLVAAYDGALTYADTWIGIMANHLQQLGIADQSVMVVLGDHGEELMDHAFFSHRVNLFDDTQHVPLVMWAPSRLRPARVGAVVELRALSATLLEIMGTGEPPEDSLLGLARGAAPASPGAASGVAVSEGIYPQDSIRDAQYRLVFRAARPHDPQFAEQLRNAPLDARSFALYDVVADPGETIDLLATPPAEAVRAHAEGLRAELVRRLLQPVR